MTDPFQRCIREVVAQQLEELRRVIHAGGRAHGALQTDRLCIQGRPRQRDGCATFVAFTSSVFKKALTASLASFRDGAEKDQTARPAVARRIYSRGYKAPQKCVEGSRSMEYAALLCLYVVLHIEQA